MSDDKKGDLDLDFTFDDDCDLESIFGEDEKNETELPGKNIQINKVQPNDIQAKKEQTRNAQRKRGQIREVHSQAVQPEIEIPHEKKSRSLSDFEPDMDALLISAESSMIIEGMKYFIKKDFSSGTLPIYLEALKGVQTYIKIFDRNPANYSRLKKLIDSDIDCQKVERIVFDFYKKTCGEIPETNHEKLDAFERFQTFFKSAVDKSSISNSMRTIKKYLFISGETDEEKLQECIRKGETEFKIDIKNIHQHLKLALEIIKKGKGEITRNGQGRDLNVYIINASKLLCNYYKIVGNSDNSNYYDRIYEIYKKYVVIRE